MKKSFLILPVIFLLTYACQQQEKQYFTTSPEIDLVKKANDAYFKGDWETFKSCYSDTAKVWINTDPAHDSPITVDQMIDSFKKGLENTSEYKIGDFYVNEMTVNDNGGRWVHTWLTWTGKTKDGKDVIFPVNLSSNVVDNKIVIAGLIYNALPGYLASLPSDSTMMTH